MIDHGGSGQPQPPSRPDKPTWLIRTVRQLQRYRYERRAQKSKESPADRAARSTARATWAIAVLTAVTIAVGVSQYVIFGRQLDEMRKTRESGDKSATEQMNVMQSQARAMQGQVDQMALAQRGWLAIDGFKLHGINVFPAGSGIVVFTEYNITNLGHSPVQVFFIHPRLFIADLDRIDSASVRSLCRDKEDASILDLVTYSTAILPGQSDTISGFPSAAEFSRPESMNGLDKVASGKMGFLGISPILAGCISYKTALDGSWHHTGFAFRAGTQTGNLHYQADVFPGIFGGIPMDIQQKGPVTIPQTVEVLRFSEGNFAD